MGQRGTLTTNNWIQSHAYLILSLRENTWRESVHREDKYRSETRYGHVDWQFHVGSPSFHQPSATSFSSQATREANHCPFPSCLQWAGQGTNRSSLLPADYNWRLHQFCFSAPWAQARSISAISTDVGNSSWEKLSSVVASRKELRSFSRKGFLLKSPRALSDIPRW